MDHENDPPERDTTSGRFVKGHKQLGHRRKGVPHPSTIDIRKLILTGAERHGYDGKGLDGAPGYFQFLAERHPLAYCMLLKPLIPPVRSVDDDDADTPRSAGVSIVNVLSIPNGMYIGRDGRLPNGVNVHELAAPVIEAEVEPEPEEQPSSILD